MPTKLTPTDISTIDTALRGLVSEAEFECGHLDCLAIRNTAGRRVAEVPAVYEYQNVAFAILNASRAIQQLRQVQECGHPASCIGKVDENDNNETPSCMWCGDIQDMHTVVQHLGKVYSHITNGRISKPMTLPEEVIAVADDLETERTEAAIAEAHPITIIVNGTPVPLRNTTVTYYDLVRHAGFAKGQVIRSVTYRRGPGGCSGTLRPGSYVKIVDGMVFDATDTYPGDVHPPVNITVNGKEFRLLDTAYITYDGIVQRAGQNFVGIKLGSELVKIPTLMTVTYRNGPKSMPEGVVSPGESVRLLSGMIFNVVDMTCA